jgi:hypothetical protein
VTTNYIQILGNHFPYILLNHLCPGLQVFEDKDDAVRYCDLLQGGGQGCEGITEIEASSVRYYLVDLQQY